jgi:hypothetical protein
LFGTATTTTIIIELTTTAISTTLDKKIFIFLNRKFSMIINLRILVGMIQHQLHLVCHNQLDDILVDFGHPMVMLVEQYQLKSFL